MKRKKRNREDRAAQGEANSDREGRRAKLGANNHETSADSNNNKKFREINRGNGYFLFFWSFLLRAVACVLSGAGVRGTGEGGCGL